MQQNAWWKIMNNYPIEAKAKEVGQTKILYLISIPWFFFRVSLETLEAMQNVDLMHLFSTLKNLWMPKTLIYTQAPFELIQESINKDFRRRSRVEGNSNERHKEDWREES